MDLKTMTLYSYVVRHDTGFAPNPYGGFCTLACCKPGLRKRARVGDWIIGLTPRALGSKIIYFMCVDEILTYEAYWNDSRFINKKPQHSKEYHRMVGDNIYEPRPNGSFKQHSSQHSNGAIENHSNKEHDLNGKYVLISQRFSYFGAYPLVLPPNLDALRVGRNYRCRFSDEVLQAFELFVRDKVLGMVAIPTGALRPERCKRVCEMVILKD